MRNWLYHRLSLLKEEEIDKIYENLDIKVVSGKDFSDVFIEMDKEEKIMLLIENFEPEKIQKEIMKVA